MSAEQDPIPPKSHLLKRDPLIIERSPIEFVLVGPKGSDHGILCRSKEARIDLIGFSASDRDQLRFGSTDGGLLSRILEIYGLGIRKYDNGQLRHMNAVVSAPVEPPQPDKDGRKQRYRFCWVGPCTHDEMEKVKTVFERQLPDIILALRRKNHQHIEWVFSPIILECSIGIDNWASRRVPYRQIMWLYAMFIFILSTTAGLVALIQYLSRNPL